MKKQNLYTIKETIEKLDLIDLNNELVAKLKDLPVHGEIGDAETYKDIIAETSKKAVLKNLTEDTNNSTHDFPEVGDIAILKVKLDKPKSDKDIYEGYEQRPILIINVHNDSVDGLEITHSDSFKGYPLFLLKDALEGKSYVNYFFEGRHHFMEYEYDFPADFTDDHKPMTFKEYCDKYKIGTVVKTKDADEPFIIKFDYNSIYKGSIDTATYNKLIRLVDSVDKE